VESLAKEALRDALENLSYRERRVLELRYGLGGEHPRTLDEVGRTFNVTRERIRQIENQSLKKLQTLPEAQQLHDDVEIASSYALRLGSVP
jgi:RNA polymerase primary sigma factor